MPLPKPTFNNVLSHYPLSANDFGGGGRIIDNPAYEHSCALRLSTALEAASPGFLGEFAGNRAVHRSPGHGSITFPFARSAQSLANYLAGAHIGWNYRRLNSRTEAFGLTAQGIIFWKINPNSGSPNHIDLWDPSMRALRNVSGRTMLWAPAEGIIEYAWFWDLKRGGALSPPSIGHSLQSG
jgi:Type VI secretion system (T6SS), amidase effector protein 4